MSPVFGHGRLRLYLLKLLEESPKHGYEVIRLLQDRFLGLYSPSPGTIYPRLARLEAEGLVSHKVVAGKKVFSLTDKGRAELNARLDELAELEREISDSVRDIAREVKEDVRETVRSLREELTKMARGTPGGRADAREEARRAKGERKAEWWRLVEQVERQADEWRRQAQNWRQDGERWASEWRRIWRDTWTVVTGGDDGGAGSALAEELADFVTAIREEAARSPLTDEKLRQCRVILADAADRIRETLR
jgi:DNA-binding PadR family transcriptional regulator